ncbi:hypothetical protein D9M68_647360 [compost metagenome]
MRVHDEGLLIQCLDGQAILDGQRVAGGHGEHEGFAQQAFTRETLLAHGRTNDTQVDSSRTQCFELVEGIHFQERDIDPGQLALGLGDHLGQEFIDCAGDEADGHRADFALCDAFG